MATTASMVQTADSPTLKRAFAPDLVSNTFLPSKKCEREFSFPSSRPFLPSHSQSWPNNNASRSPRSGQRSTRPRRPSMVQASSRTFAPPMPTFMSVFGEEATGSGLRTLSSHRTTASHGASVGRPASSGNILSGSTGSNAAFAAFHVHRDSTSTLASESSDSSPTTTISTMDSSSVTDPSPGPSPESPVAKPTNTSFVADFRSRRTESGDNSPNTFFELQRPTTPAKKPRNLKNLGINTSTSLNNLRTNPTAAAKPERNTSAPASPSFIKPPTPPKRRPSNLSLTIQTPGSDSKPMRLVIPSNPALNRPALRHFQSSPSLPLCSPSVSSNGPMRLPPLRPIKTNPHGFAEVPIEQEEEDQEPNFDIPQSREEKPAAYPNGPICIYECGVYLYFEPTTEQAMSFDVIVNVASEVKNPFTNPVSESQKDIDARRVDGPPAENVDFATLPERSKKPSLDTEASSPTTPKATPVLETVHVQPGEKLVNGAAVKTPEYIHMPWEHNTDIVPDLYKLVKIMDDRVKQGKRILVHCQCGVSRSASLIVAYGLYKNPGISVQEAYDSVKKRSKWIGPNMNLIMQLQEFRNGLLRANESRSHNQGFGFPRRSAGLSTGVSTGTNRHSPFDRETQSGSRTPRTAPLPPDTDMNMQRASTGNMISVSPGPLSAPSGQFFSPDFRRSWAPSQTHFDLSASPKVSPTAAPYVDPKGHLVPKLSLTDEPAPLERPHSSAENMESTQFAAIKQPPVPNFSRQLPFRTSTAPEFGEDSLLPAANRSEVFLMAPPPPMDALCSPMVASFNIPPAPTMSSFNIPPLSPIERPRGADMFPPKRMEFNVSSWSQSEEPESRPSYLAIDRRPEPLISPRATEFHLAPLKQGTIDDSYNLLSPSAPNFKMSFDSQEISRHTDRDDDDFEVASPSEVTQFPKDPFANSKFTFDSVLTSPRGTEFHMAPLKPDVDVANEDPFGLTSPTRFEFPSHSTEKELTPPTPTEDDRRPSFQAILPPSHEAFNGFVSLNGTAAEPAVSVPALPDRASHSMDGDLNREDIKTTEAQPTSSSERPNGLQTSTSEPVAVNHPAPPRIPEDKDSHHLTPSKPMIRTRFSSPNMREQRKLHKLQTEMEAMLPNRMPQLPTQAFDDLDALMSPRAEEFTRNPFHFDLQNLVNETTVDETSPASSVETVKDMRTAVEWKDSAGLTPVQGFATQHLTPQKVAEDPRSPVLPGSSPIVRNIWDVL